MSSILENPESARDALTPTQRSRIAVILVGGIMSILDGSMVIVAAGTLADRFDATPAVIGWASTGYLLAIAVTIPVTGWAVDRIGGRRLWLLGLSVFLLGSLGAGLAPNLAILLGFRVLQGIGAGIVDPLMLTLLARTAGPRHVGKVTGLMGAVGSCGPIVGPIAGGLLLQYLDWRWMFMVNLPIVLIAIALAVRILPRDTDSGPATSRLDTIGLVLLGPGIAAIVLALTRIGEHGTVGSRQVAVPAALGVAALFGYAWHAHRASAALLDPRPFRHARFLAALGATSLVGFGTYASLFILPLYYQHSRGFGPATAGLYLAPLGLGAAVGMTFSGRLSDRYGARYPCLVGCLTAATAALAFTFLDGSTSDLVFGLVSLLIGAGLGTAGAPPIGAVFRILPAELSGQAGGVLYMANQLGSAFGIAVVGVITVSAPDSMLGLGSVFGCVTVVLLAAVLVAAGLPGGASPALKGQH